MKLGIASKSGPKVKKGESKKNHTKIEITQFLIELQPKIFTNS